MPLTIPYEPRLRGLDIKALEGEMKGTGTLVKIDKVNWPNEYPDSRETTVKVAHDGETLILSFDCKGEDLQATVDEDLGPVANDSCVEFFVSPDAGSPRYWNFEFNCIGKKNVSTRVERKNPRRLTPEELSRIEVASTVGSEPFAEKRGRHEWRLLVRIPLALFDVVYPGERIEMRGNFYKCGAKTSSPHYLSWSPIETDTPDFHRTEFFDTLILG